ncbi:MAG: DUF1016 N-terminal domain-containing protein [Rhizonema sp. PD38]|nr:DUF1016 N-terminal domain-containing protein [Rhizonema sp. PD38]
METNVSGGNCNDKNKSKSEKLSKTQALVPTDAIVTDQLVGDIRILIEKSRDHIAQTINTELVLLYWHIGKRIRSKIIGEGRAEYGQRVVEALSQTLVRDMARDSADEIYLERSALPKFFLIANTLSKMAIRMAAVTFDIATHKGKNAIGSS